jgi:protein-tyrosine phosphatase
MGKRQGTVMRQRRIAMDGAVNFRDIGGYKAGTDRQTRWGRVYRADSLADLSDADLQRLTALDLFGIADFRLPSEREARPDRLPEGHDMMLLTPGFIPKGTEDMLHEMSAGRIGPAEIRAEVLGHYRLFVTDHLGVYAAPLRMILQADGRGVLFHCTSGKDRTGFGIALVLLAAGCAEDDIIADYELTNIWRRDVRFMFRDGVDPAALDMLTSAPGDYIAEALKQLRIEHGPDWLQALGFDPAERARLRDLLTEPAGD